MQLAPGFGTQEDMMDGDITDACLFGIRTTELNEKMKALPFLHEISFKCCRSRVSDKKKSRPYK